MVLLFLGGCNVDVVCFVGDVVCFGVEIGKLKWMFVN